MLSLTLRTAAGSNDCGSLDCKDRKPLQIMEMHPLPLFKCRTYDQQMAQALYMDYASEKKKIKSLSDDARPSDRSMEVPTRTCKLKKTCTERYCALKVGSDA